MPGKYAINDIANNLNTQIQTYNASHSYVNYSANETLLTQVINNNDLGYICPAEGSSSPAISMVPFDNNLYNDDSAKYNMGMFYSNIKFNQQNSIRTKSLKPQYKSGLQLNAINSYNTNNDPLYFLKNQNGLTYSSINNVNDKRVADLSSLQKIFSVSSKLANINTNFSFECFGYFSTGEGGHYQFEVITGNGGSAYLWADDNALVGYKIENSTCSPSTSRQSNFINIASSSLSPIRIQYTYNGTSGGAAFKLNVYKEGAPNVYSPITASNSPFISSDNWEPTQIYYTLIPSPRPGLSSILITPYDTTNNNNITYNNLVRQARVNPQLIYTNRLASISALAVSCSTISFSSIGDIILQQNGSQVLNITNINQSGLSTCNDTRTITITDVLIGHTSFLSQTKISPLTSTSVNIELPYINNDDQIFKDNCNLRNKKCSYTVKYTVGSQQLSKTYTVTRGKTVNLSFQQQANLCNLKLMLLPLTLPTSASPYPSRSKPGDLIIANTNPDTNQIQIIWSLSTNFNTSISNAVSNPVWLSQYQTQLSKGIDLSILTAGSTIDPTGTLPYMLSSDGFFKLTIQNGQFVINYCTTPTPVTQAANPNIFHLYGILSDEKIGRTYIVDSCANTLTNLPYGSILSLSNTYTQYSSSNNNSNSNPPIDTTSTANGISYSTMQVDEATCATTCNTTSGCSHYYSYKKGGQNQCTINTDFSNFRLYPTSSDPSITSAKLMVRQPTITPHPVYTSPANAQITSQDSTKYSMYHISSNSISPTQQVEGSAGSSIVSSYINWLSGKKPTSTESFETSGQKAMESMVPGYNTNNSCTNPGNNAGAINRCINDISSNIQALNTYATTYQGQTNQISAKYTDLSNNISNFNTNWSNINVTNSSYDAIDGSGNLNYDYKYLPSPNTSDVLLNDMHDTLIQQNATYIVGTITAATLIVAALVIGRNS